jgi:hypothetical protein
MKSLSLFQLICEPKEEIQQDSLNDEVSISKAKEMELFFFKFTVCEKLQRPYDQHCVLFLGLFLPYFKTLLTPLLIKRYIVGFLAPC